MRRFLFKGPYGSAIVAVVRRWYMNGNVRLELSDDEGYPYAVASLNIPNIRLGEDEIVVKNYGENEGMLHFLLTHNIIEVTNREVHVGFGNICRICIVKPENHWRYLTREQLQQLKQTA